MSKSSLLQQLHLHLHIPLTICTNVIWNRPQQQWSSYQLPVQEKLHSPIHTQAILICRRRLKI